MSKQAKTHHASDFAYRSVIVRFWTAVRQSAASVSLAGSSSGPYLQAKSSVTPKGVPSSSLRAYRFPIEVFESSTREKTPALRSFDAAPQTVRTIPPSYEAK